MAITSGLCVSAKLALLRSMENDEFKVALYGPEANLSPINATEYTPEGEVKAKGYTPGGKTLQGLRIDLDGTTAIMGWERDPVWNNVSIKAKGAMIYNASRDNVAIAICEFDDVKISTNGNFRLEMPPLSATTAAVWLG